MSSLQNERHNRRSSRVGPAWLLSCSGLLASAAIGGLFCQEELLPTLLLQTSRSQSATTSVSVVEPLPPGRGATSPARFVAVAKPNEAEVAWSQARKEHIRNWANRAPVAVAAWAVALPAGGNRQFVIETVALAWGSANPISASKWARSLPDAAERAIALAGVAGEAARTAPILAIELAESLSEPTRNEIVSRAASEWAMQDPEAAAEWALQISGEVLRADVLARIATAWSERDPSAAANLTLDEIPEGRLQANTIVSIVQRWAQQSPADAAAWVEQFPTGDIRAAAAENLGRDRRRD